MTETEKPKTALQAKTETIAGLLAHKEEALGALVGPRRLAKFCAAVMAEITRKPELAECTIASVYSAVHYCAMLNLDPGPHAHVYMIPFRNRKLGGARECTIITGYKGMMELARRHPLVEQPTAELVYEDDHFVYDVGAKTIEHSFDQDADHSDPKKIVGAYSRVDLVNSRRPLILYLTREQIEQRRKRSQQPDGNFWTNDYPAMARKSAVRAHYNGGEVPLSHELQQALAAEVPEEVVDVEHEVTDSERGPGSGVADLKAALGIGVDDEPAVAEDADTPGAAELRASIRTTLEALHGPEAVEGCLYELEDTHGVPFDQLGEEALEAILALLEAKGEEAQTDD